MLARNFSKRPVEGTISSEPLVGDDPQGVMVTGTAWFALKLLRSHIGSGACNLLGALVAGTLGHQSNAKITERERVAPIKQYILWLHVTMDQLFIVSIL